MVRLPEWRSRAACRGRLDLDFIDPAPAQVAACRAICAECPVRNKCLAEALDNGEAWGIWGGHDTDEREQLAERTGHPAPVVKPSHGTNSRYAKHGCRCDFCRQAHTAYERVRREARQARRRAAEMWTRPVVLGEPVRAGRAWAPAGQYLLPLVDLPAPREAASVVVEVDTRAVVA